MKYLVFIGIALVSITSCVQAEKETSIVDSPVSTEVKEHKELGGLNICFYNQDSLQIHFNYFREQDSIITKKQLAYQSEIQRKSQDLQNYIIKYEERAKANLLSQNEAMQMQQAAQQKEQTIMQYQQTVGARLEEETYNKMEVIGNKIEFFATQYSEENGIDLLLVHARGGQFKYIHSSMDVTADFTKYLNEHQDALTGDIEK
ncbi:MAG: OmpH family outer membrane protein [Crocinitomicaceae bacterium]|nr:OmpH family outer membrane protein [Crocinitomicaceae bacterium]MDG1775957.1 OmpH family outer membrane protein [Crocinitomicaceae bacterium]